MIESSLRSSSYVSTLYHKMLLYPQKEIAMPSSYTLGEHYEKFVRDLVQSGRYASASEVLRDSLRLMEERETERAAKLDRLKAEIAKGLREK